MNAQPNSEPFLVTRALRVVQPLGVYFVAVLPARALLDVAFTDLTSAHARSDGRGYDIDGTQRFRQDKRLDEIAAFLKRGDAAIPNSIILAANYRQEDGRIEEDEELDDDNGDTSEASPPSRRWTIVERDDGCYDLTIPTRSKLAAVIDGQHRLFAFARVSNETSDPLSMDLLCSIYMDLPKPYQASLFATVNSTQKRVDKSLTYELFGYNVEEEPRDAWTPDKLAVYMTRLLGTDAESPLRGRILIAPEKDRELRNLAEEGDWRVSTAIVVEGLLKLFSANPKRDSNTMAAGSRPNRSLLEIGRDKSPLRSLYIAATQDDVIYRVARNFLVACDAVFWEKRAKGSFIVRTVGVQALFDVLRHIAGKVMTEGDASVDRLTAILERAKDADFSEDRFRNASGSGRTIIRREIEERIGEDYFPHK
ncbi:DGQHR domain-containing protein [Sphingopyxis sp.]|jgi:DNA phosphorothioation-associated DGQHR protein 1|uniref:DGQHR domain-containing protein n=1 Tax=Sphingopyxis sp. TaxID=1908224 RepID=UPI002DE97FD2|nr:DGQHR domain-containing protein [Sphingopyxis sp.]